MSEFGDLIRDVVSRGGTRDDLWSVLTELGLTAVGVAEDAGGSGGTLDDLTEVVRALARHGVQAPVAEHASAFWAMASTGVVPTLGTLAHVPSLPAAGDIQLVVPWASQASHVVVVPLTGEVPAMLDMKSGTAAITPGTDVAGRPLDHLEVPTGALTSIPGAAAMESTARLALLRCAAIVGAAEAAYTLTRTHVGAREQFGRPLVQIPAVAASLARLRVEVLQAQTALSGALATADSHRFHSSAVSARVVCGAAATESARIAHQLHGAIGITDEYPLHRHTRTLWALRDADLPEEQWAAALGDLVLDGGEDRLWEHLTAVDPDDRDLEPVGGGLPVHSGNVNESASI